MIRAILTSGSMRSLRHKPDRSCATKPGHISCHRHPLGGTVRSNGLPRGPQPRDRPMPLAGTRRRTPNLASAEEIAAEYRNGPLRVPKAQAAQALHDAADALRLPNRARLLIRVLLDTSPTADWTRAGGLIGVWPSIETLKRKTGLSKAALGRAQADLREAGLVAFRDSGNHKGTVNLIGSGRDKAGEAGH